MTYLPLWVSLTLVVLATPAPDWLVALPSVAMAVVAARTGHHRASWVFGILASVVLVVFVLTTRLLVHSPEGVSTVIR